MTFQNSGCTFCGACVTACETGALQRQADDEAPWRQWAVVTGQCLAVGGVVCRLCEEACEELAIRFRLGLNGTSFPEIDPEMCTGCGACLPPCPVKALEIRPRPEPTRGETRHHDDSETREVSPS